METTTDAISRAAQTAVRIIRETPGLTAEQIGGRMGGQTARTVRDYIGEARDAGEPITIGLDNRGYYHVGDDGIDDETRADMVKHHRNRAKGHMRSAAHLMKLIGQMTATQVAEMSLLDLVVPDAEVERPEDRPTTMSDLARLPADRRSGLVRVFRNLLDAMDNDPEAWAAERAMLADEYGTVFLTRAEAGKIAAAREALEAVKL